MAGNGNLIDRDISWLSFNERVLEEAGDHSVPLYDRIKFLGIYSSNLDEFYRVRVASIRSLKGLNKKKLKEQLDSDPESVLAEVGARVQRQQEQFGEYLQKQIIPELREQGIRLAYTAQDIPESAKAKLTSHFKSRVLSYLQPVIIRSGIKPFLSNQGLYLLLKIKQAKADDYQYAYINIPSPPLSRFYSFHDDPTGLDHIVFIDDIIRLNLSTVFPGFTISEAFSIKLNRDADLLLGDEYTGDLVKKINQNLKKRSVGKPSRFLYDQVLPVDMLSQMMDAIGLEEEDLVPGGRYHNLSDLLSLPLPRRNDLVVAPWTPLLKDPLEKSESLFRYIDRNDVMLHFPYHSYDYVLRFFNEAAVDPRVKEIKATFYRVASDSFIVNALISAARNGKKVKAFIEVKARFDEANNLFWAERMKEAGIKITYSIPGLKVHAKAALIRMESKAGKSKFYAFLGTGNFNEKTAGIYADHGLLTSNRKLTRELDSLFKYLYKEKPMGGLKELLISQFNLVKRFSALVDAEIKNVKKGGKGHILVKVNNLEDPVMIDKLYEASMAGVKVRIIVRGICCLQPGVRPISEKIEVIRIVDRYLEHARVFVFHSGGKDLVYLGSADLMRRNLYRRIEVVFPVVDAGIKEEIMRMLAFQLHDNTKARRLDQDLNNNVILRKEGAPKIQAQRDFYFWLKNRESANSI